MRRALALVFATPDFGTGASAAFCLLSSASIVATFTTFVLASKIQFEMAERKKAQWVVRIGASAASGVISVVVCLVFRDYVPLFAFPILGFLVGMLIGIFLQINYQRGSTTSTPRATHRTAASENKSTYVWSLQFLCGITAITCLGTLICCLYGVYLPRHNLQHLIANASQTELSAVVFTGQGQRIVLADSESTAYFTAAFRSAAYDGYNARCIGTTYAVELRFNRIGSISLRAYVSRDCDGLSVACEDDISGMGDLVYYWIPLIDPKPQATVEALEKLR